MIREIQRATPHLLADVLPAVLATDHVLDDRILGEVLINGRDKVQGEAYGKEVDDLVEKVAKETIVSEELET